MEDFQQKIIDIWDRNVEQGDQYTIPWLDVTDEQLNQLRNGTIYG